MKDKEKILPFQYYPDAEEFAGDFNLGAKSDSFYEYIYKSYLLDGKRDKVKRKIWEISKQKIFKTLVVQTNQTNPFTYIKTVSYHGDIMNRHENLSCFYPGVLFLQQIHEGYNATEFKIADEILRTCVMQYVELPGKFPADILYWGSDNNTPYVHQKINEYMLNPETVESLYYAWRLTHDEQYRDIAAYIYDNLWTIARGNYGFCSLIAINSPYPRCKNEQPSWVQSELLKYLYLIFDDENRVDLTKQVFNTQGHLLNVLKD